TLDSDADTTSGRTVSFTLASGATDNTKDAGFFQGATIGDLVFSDSNANGIQDAGESGIDGVTVKLLDSSNNTLATTTTANGGVYSFTSLTPGSYSVEFVKPSGYFFSAQDQGSDDALDSDANTSTGRTAQFTLSSGQS